MALHPLSACIDDFIVAAVVFQAVSFILHVRQREL